MAGEYKKLYPPVIEGTLPAFSGTELSVPFSMNRAVSDTEVYGFIVKIKNVYNNTNIKEFKCKLNSVEEMPAAAVFEIADAEASFNVGDYYKVQMAYLWKNPADPDNSNYVGFFSTVGVVKYTTKPTITIANMDDKIVNAYNYIYTGIYSQEGKDTTERAYKYCFNLYDGNSKLIKTSDWTLHNITQDNLTYESSDTYEFNQDLEMNRVYYINYQVETTNGLIESSPRYKVMQSLSINPEIQATLIPIMNKDNGYVDLRLQGEPDPESGIEKAVTGMFKIVRASSIDNFSSWDEVLKFSLYGQQPSRALWKDFTVQQGITYKYALQQYNEQLLTSNRIESVSVIADFEDMFLYDGQRQLKVRFNPKISSFKNTILESKTDTIGSKYPFIFRNGNVKYKEFPLSGLISYHADEEQLFMNYDLDTIDTNLTSENIAVERDFKLEVLEWLTNGQPKLFRSPTEGNYIVRLMNTSLAPTDAVGRMLHTFSATAYEIDDCNYQTLNQYNFVNAVEPSTKQLRWESVLLNSEVDNLLDYAAVGLDITGALPGTMIYIDDGLVHETSMNLPADETTGFVIAIGATGSYHLDIDNSLNITRVAVMGSLQSYDYERMQTARGALSYAYYSKLLNQFDMISSVTVEEIPLQQFIGSNNILASINDIKNEVQAFYYLHFQKRDVRPAYLIDGVYYQSLHATNVLQFDPWVIYEIRDIENNFVHYLDGNTQLPISDVNYKFYINGSSMSVEDTLEYTTYTITDIDELKIASGVIMECAYQKQIKTFALEEQDTEIAQAKHAYEITDDRIHQLIYDYINDNESNLDEASLQQRERDLRAAREAQTTTYNQFITLLDKKIKEKEAVQGDPV